MFCCETTSGNAKKLDRLESIVSEILAEALKHGFFGTARIEFNVQDGTIQSIRRMIERVEK